MSVRGWLVVSDSVTSINIWRWTVFENYSLDRWWNFLKASFPLIKGYSVGFKHFQIPAQGESFVFFR